MHHDVRPLEAPAPPRRIRLALWRAELAAAQVNPWRASLFMRRLGALASRLSELRDGLARLPRRMRRGWARQWIRALPAALLLLVLATGRAEAATITVDPGGSGCTLEDAIVAANTDTATGSCPAGDLGTDTINFANANGTYLLDTNYGGALPDIESRITIQGSGATLDAEAAFPVLRVRATGDLTVDDATITGGRDYIFGGGAFNEGSLSLVGCTVTSNVGDRGGAVHNRGTLVVEESVISGNSANSAGGGIYNDGGATATILNSTISGNFAYLGGGIRNFAGDQGGATATILNSTISGNFAYPGGGILKFAGNPVGLRITGSTISGNTAYYAGGGIANGGDVDGDLRPGSAEIVNTTISGNSAYAGGGVYNAYGTVGLIHTTIARNRAVYGGGIASSAVADTTVSGSIVADQQLGSDDCDAGGPGSIVSNGFNLESGTTCGFTTTGDIQNGDPDLGPLQNNGGTTETHAISPTSDALHAADNTVCAASPVDGIDQRGIVRPQPAGGICDIGAFELELVATPTAAQVLGFAAAPDPTGRVRITWETAVEVDVVAFQVQRAPEVPGAWSDVAALVPARGGAAAGARYSVTDLPGVGSFTYRLVIVNALGPPSMHGSVGAVVRALRTFLPAVFAR